VPRGKGLRGSSKERDRRGDRESERERERRFGALVDGVETKESEKRNQGSESRRSRTRNFYAQGERKPRFRRHFSLRAFFLIFFFFFFFSQGSKEKAFDDFAFTTKKTRVKQRSRDEKEFIFKRMRKGFHSFEIETP